MKKIILAAIIGTTLSGTAIAKQVNNDNNVVFGGAKSGFVIEVEQKMMQYNESQAPTAEVINQIYACYFRSKAIGTLS